MDPIVCPICGFSTLERILEEISISANVNGERPVNAMVAYRCRENGHIFFVRKADMASLAEERKAAAA